MYFTMTSSICIVLLSIVCTTWAVDNTWLEVLKCRASCLVQHEIPEGASLDCNDVTPCQFCWEDCGRKNVPPQQEDKKVDLRNMTLFLEEHLVMEEIPSKAADPQPVDLLPILLVTGCTVSIFAVSAILLLLFKLGKPASDPTPEMAPQVILCSDRDATNRETNHYPCHPTSACEDVTSSSFPLNPADDASDEMFEVSFLFATKSTYFHVLSPDVAYYTDEIPRVHRNHQRAKALNFSTSTLERDSDYYNLDTPVPRPLSPIYSDLDE